MLDSVLTVILSGLTMGAIYALVAEGLNLIWGVMGLVNLAHGEFLMLGTYLTFFTWAGFGLNPLASVIFSFAILFLVGMALNKAIIRHVIGAPPLMSMLLTFGLSICLTNLGVIVFGGKLRTVRFLTETWDLWGVRIPQARLVAAVVAIVISLVMYIFLKRSRLGVAIRAVVIDRVMAEECGVNTGRIYTITLGLGAGLAAVAGSLVSTIFAFNPLIGQTFILKAFAVVVLGGMGNFLGALLGGLTMGVVEAAVGFFYNVHLSEAISFLVIILTLLLRPSGLLGGEQ